VRVPLLPGHGRTVAEFDATSHAQWIDAARSELIAMRARYRWAALGGLSMGGALAALLAGEVRDVPALVLMAPYLRMPAYMRTLAACYPLWSDRVGPIRARSSDSIHDPAERMASLSYGAVTGRVVHELALLVREARHALARVTAPTLIIQSREDRRIPPRVARRAFAVIRSESKRLVFTHGAGHIITVDYGREEVFQEVQRWLEHGPGTAIPASDSRLV
jgi:carboxylesterase